MQSWINFRCFIQETNANNMAHAKGAAAGKGKGGSAVNATTGNKITRDSSSGRFYVTKTEAYSTDTPKRPKTLAASTLSNKGAGFSINKRKAEKAEQVVVEYINKSRK